MAWIPRLHGRENDIITAWRDSTVCTSLSRPCSTIESKCPQSFLFHGLRVFGMISFDVQAVGLSQIQELRNDELATRLW